MAREGVFLKRRINDQLLTVLTILLSLLLFMIAPMQANGVISETSFGLIFGLVLIPATIMVWGNPVAVGAILVALGLVFLAAIRQGTLLDRYLDAFVGLIVGLTLSIVVARAVFARDRPGSGPSTSPNGSRLGAATPTVAAEGSSRG